MIRSEIGKDDMKVNFSKVVLLQIMNMIIQMQKSKNWKTQKQRIFMNIGQRQKKIIEFLKFKYPRNKKAFVPTQLDQLFQQIDDSEHTDHDILINAGINFDYEEIQNHGKKYIIGQIKRFFNTLIEQTNKEYQKFRVSMESLFQGFEGHFKIGRKIPQNVGKFADLDIQNLEIHSPEIFRIIIKWIGSMEGVFLKTVKQLHKIKYFKIVQQNGQEFNYFPMYTNKTQIISILTTQLQKSSKQYKQQEVTHQKYLSNFNQTIIKILSRKTNLPQINHNEIKTIKYSSYTSKFIQFLATQKLVYLLRELTQLRKTMDEKIRKGIDLINCNVTDLMRAQFMGSKTQLIKVYNKLGKLQSQGKIIIVRIKNRFDTPLNDALINFKFTSSFIICELQLVLQKSATDSTNQKQKIAQTVNHVLYQLQRSIFGPMAQMSLLINHNDTRMGYEKKIKLDVLKLKKLRCPQKQILAPQYDFGLPYVCSLCSTFYHINQNSFPIHRCLNCNFYVCPGCLFSFDNDIEKECYQKQMFQYIKENWHQVEQNQDFQFYFFDKKYHKANDLMKKNFLFDTLQEMLLQMEKTYVFLFKFSQGKRYLKGYSVKSGAILPIFYEYLPRGERKKFKQQKIGPLDIILFLNPLIQTHMKFLKDFHLVSTYLADVQINQKKVSQIYFFKWEKNFYIIDIGQIARDANPDSNKPNAQLLQVNKILQKYKPMEGRLELDYLDLASLNFQKNAIKNLRFAKLSNNHLRDISLILEFESLQQINILRNDILQIQIKKIMPKLRVFDLSENYIEKVFNFNNKFIPNLKQLRLNSNNISEFPQFQLQKLLWLNLNDNQIKTIKNVTKFAFPKLRKLQLSKNKIEQIPQLQMNELLDVQIDENQLKTMYFLKEWRKLQNISLCGNNIEEVPQLKLQYLKNFQLCNNKLKEVELLATSYLPSLRKLDFSQNSIQNLPSINFQELRILILQKNKITSVESLNTSQIPFIAEINFRDNLIQKLSIFTFDDLKKINFSKNRLKSITQIIHSGIPSIQQILLSNNEIVDLPSLQCPKLINLDLQYNQITSFANFKDSIIPNLKVLKLSNNLIVEFFSADFPGLFELQLQNNRLEALDQIKEEHLQKLKILNFNNNLLSTLPTMHLQSVQKLFLIGNRISSLQLFKNSTFPCMKILSFKDNELTSFPRMKCDSLLNLQLTNNKINTMHGLAQCEFPQLQQLHLDKNFIEHLNILKLPKLVLLDLQQNKIQNISPMEDFDLPQISVIILRNNVIQSLCKLKSLSLNELYLGQNRIKQLRRFSESQLPKLTFLELCNNQISGQIPQFFFPSLKKLELQKNQISSVNKLFNSVMLKLDTLKLSNNKIQSLSVLNVNQLPKLKELQLNYNILKDIDDFCRFSVLPKIAKLSLNHNKLHNLPSMDFVTLSALNVQQNQIENLHDFAQSNLPNLQKLNLKSNRIKMWIKSHYLEKLEKLNLAQNKLIQFDEIVSDSVPALLELNLKKNKIRKVPDVFDLPFLEKLMLQGNPIQETLNQIKQKLKKSSINANLKCTFDKQESAKQPLMSQNPQLQKKQSLFSDLNLPDIIEIKPRFSQT